MNTARDSGRVALLVGASGLIGRRLLALMTAAGDYDHIHTLVRAPGAAAGPELAEHVIDFERLETAAAAIDRVDDVFCALGTTLRKAGSQAAFRRVDHDYIVATGRLAVRCDARQMLLVSSLGADPRARSFYLRVKGETEAALRALDLPGLAIFRPSLLKGPRDEFRLGEQMGNLAMGMLSSVLPQRVRPVTDVELATAMVRVAREGCVGVQVFEFETIRQLAAGA
jgi:uncharacterized protein YbjT (DUF2867 family)